MAANDASADTLQAALERRFEQLPALVNDDENLLRRGRFADLDLLVEIGPTPYYLCFRGGRLAHFERGPKLMRSWTVAVRGEAEGWRRLWEPVPEAGFHDLFALAKRGQARIEGDLQPFMANLQFFKDVLAAPRQLPEEG